MLFVPVLGLVWAADRKPAPQPSRAGSVGILDEEIDEIAQGVVDRVYPKFKEKVDEDLPAVVDRATQLASDRLPSIVDNAFSDVRVQNRLEAGRKEAYTVGAFVVVSTAILTSFLTYQFLKKRS